MLLFVDDTNMNLKDRLDEFLQRPALQGAFGNDDHERSSEREVLKQHFLNVARTNRKTSKIMIGLLRRANSVEFIEEKGTIIVFRNLLDAAQGEPFLMHEYLTDQKV